MFSSAFTLVESNQTVTGSELIADHLGLKNRVPFGSTVHLYAPSATQIASAFSVLDGWAKSVHLHPPGAEKTTCSNTDFQDYVVAVPESSSTKFGSDTEWILYTSGTTGAPKPISHRLSKLASAHRRTEANESLFWGLLYEPTRMAGIQVLIHTMVTGSSLAAARYDSSLADKLMYLRTHHVNALSATPTLWRQIIQNESSREWDLKQITLGGEVADQKILNALRSRFPGARVSHVYASTEVGAAFTVHDGLEGFPESFMIQPPKGITLKISNEGTLEIKIDGEELFFDSGDNVLLVGNRYHFQGRQSGLANIGGAKVWPEEVEGMLRQHEWVREARVFAKPNSMSGQILVAHVVAEETAPSDLQKVLRKWIRETRPNHFVPAIIAVVDHLHVNAAGKIDRKLE